MKHTENTNPSNSKNHLVNKDINGLINHWFKISSGGYKHFVNTVPMGSNEDELWTFLNKRTGHLITPDHFAYSEDDDQLSIIGGLDVLLLSDDEEVLDNLISIDKALYEFTKQFHETNFYRSYRRFKVAGKKLEQLIDNHLSSISSLLKVDFENKIKTVGEMYSFPITGDIH